MNEDSEGQEFPEYEGWIFSIIGFKSTNSMTSTFFSTTERRLTSIKILLEAIKRKINRQSKLEELIIREFPMQLDLRLEGQKIRVSNVDQLVSASGGTIHAPAYVLDVIEGPDQRLGYMVYKKIGYI